MKLIEMTSYVLGIDSIVKKGEEELHNDFMIRCFLSIDQYANFLKQPLNLGMFVPCDEDWNIIEEPCYSEPKSENEIGDLDELIYQYNLAKERVLFEDITLTDAKFIIWSNKTIEDLVQYDLELTENAIKQL